jgi:sugar lactone lactonase YvrE
MKTKLSAPLVTLLLIAFASVAQKVETITVKVPGLTPEGITVNPATGKFIISSVGKGHLLEVDANGTTTVFADAPELISTLGTHVHPNGKYLATAICDIGVSQRSKKEKFGQVAAIALVDMATHKVFKVIDFTSLLPASKHFANDLTWDNKGNLYVTDSYAGAIYKVDNNYQASVFVTDSTFTLRNPYSFGLNGIAFDEGSNNLIVSKLDEGKLFKVPLDNPTHFSEVKLEKAIPADGILLQKDGTLLLVSSVNTPTDNVTSGKVHKLVSADRWVTARLVSTFDTGKPSATTITEKGADLYVVHAYYFGQQPVQEFHIQKVNFAK